MEIPKQPEKIFESAQDLYIKQAHNDPKNQSTKAQLKQEFEALNPEEKNKIEAQYNEYMQQYEEELREFQEFFKREFDTPLHLYLHEQHDALLLKFKHEQQNQEEENEQEMLKKLLKFAKQCFERLAVGERGRIQKEWEKYEQQYQAKMFEYHKQFNKKPDLEKMSYDDRLPRIVKKNTVMTPFSLFFEENKAKFVKEYKGEGTAFIKKMAQEEYEDLDDESQKKYEEKAKQLKEQIEQSEQEWENKYGDHLTEGDRICHTSDSKRKKTIKRSQYIKKGTGYRNNTPTNNNLF